MCPVIDFHMHIEQEENVNVNGIDVVINEQRIRNDMDEAGVDMAVLLVMARANDMDRTRGLNEWLAGVCDKEPRFFGFGSVHPYDGDKAIEEMDRCINDLGLSGFKLHPNTQKFDCGDSRVKDVIGHAGELGVPVIIDSYSPTDNTQSGKIVEAALQYPKTALCLAHVGGYSFMDFAVFGFLTQCSGVEHNVYFDLTAAYVWFYQTPFQEQFLWMTKQIGKDRLLFGTDFPLMGPRDESGVHRRYTSRDCIEILRDFGYPDDWLPAILGGNAARLLNIDV